MNHEGLESAIRKRNHPHIVDIVTRDVLAPIAAGDSSLLAVRHPLGFACFPFLRVEAVGACVHVWPKKRKPPSITTSPFHCHSWDLLSYVLYGSVGNQHVDITDGSTYKTFEVRTGDGVDRLVATGRRVDARGHAPEYWEAGKHYDLAAGLFHASIVVENTEAATVILGFHNPEQPDLTLGSLDTPDHPVTRRPHSADETVRIAKRTLARLADEVVPEPALVGG